MAEAHCFARSAVIAMPQRGRGNPSLLPIPITPVMQGWRALPRHTIPENQRLW